MKPIARLFLRGCGLVVLVMAGVFWCLCTSFELASLWMERQAEKLE
jgi:hypothetical protein